MYNPGEPGGSTWVTLGRSRLESTDTIAKKARAIGGGDQEAVRWVPVLGGAARGTGVSRRRIANKFCAKLRLVQVANSSNDAVV